MSLASVSAGSLNELKAKGHLTTKLGDRPVVVFWDGEQVWAIEDRCPHLGFPLHRGTVEAGMVTCHWHHARFDLSSGCTLDPFADDATSFDVTISNDEVHVAAQPDSDHRERELVRLQQGLQEGIRLVVAKSVLALLENGVPESEILSVGLRFGATYRQEGWGSGLTVLTAMANLLPYLDESQRSTALIQGLMWVSDDTRGHPTRFRLTPLHDAELPDERFESWYRRFIETSSPQAAERALTTVLEDPARLAGAERAMVAAVTDHAYLDTGHTLDFTNKAIEALAAAGPSADPGLLLTSLIAQTCRADRAEESSAWNHPHDLAAIVARHEDELPADLDAGRHAVPTEPTPEQAERLLVDDPEAVLNAIRDSLRSGLTPVQVARTISAAAALRLCRFHTQNDPADWNILHHTFTTANAATQILERQESTAASRVLYHLAAQVYLDRFLNVPAARVNQTLSADLSALTECWDHDGHVDEAGNIVASCLKAGVPAEEVIQALCDACLREDGTFHVYQSVEAAARQAMLWEPGSPQQAWPLIGAARFLSAHTPTRRTLEKVITTATRLRRGQDLFAEAE
jgi:nitrite reductase/ring-hydroxylating ferredoxin subunit